MLKWLRRTGEVRTLMLKVGLEAFVNKWGGKAIRGMGKTYWRGSISFSMGYPGWPH